MKDLFLLDVVETSLLGLKEGESTSRIRAGRILSQLQCARPNRYTGLRLADVRCALREAYPIHKNPRKRTQRYKISRRVAYEFLSQHSITMRPISHARLGTIGTVVSRGDMPMGASADEKS